MDATLTAEQSLLAEAAAAMADAGAIRSPEELPDASTLENLWQDIVALGLPALRSPELSGSTATGIELALVIEEFGRTLSALPVVGQGAIVPQLLEAAGATDIAERVAEGDLRIAPVLRQDLQGLAGHHEPGVVFDAQGATHALLLVDDGGGSRLMAARIDGEELPALDVTRVITRVVPDSLTEESLDLGGVMGDSELAGVGSIALIALAADLVGIMGGALDEVVEYIGARRQFDVPIGSFQAVQHLAADCLVRIEGARSCLWYAAWAVDHLPGDEAHLAARTAKAYASAAGRDVIEATVQMFGGIAITWEALSHLRLRRALLDRTAFGDETVHYEAIAGSRLLDPELG